MAETLTEYKLTKSEQKLLEVLMNPLNRLKTTTEVCQLAGISRETHYAAFAKPGFVAIYKDMSLNIVRSSVAPVVHAFVKEAQRGSFQHGKIVLEMAGVYTEKTKQEITGPNGESLNIAVSFVKPTDAG